MQPKIVEDKPSGAQPEPEPTQPVEVDLLHFWGPRLSLWLGRRIRAPGWGRGRTKMAACHSTESQPLACHSTESQPLDCITSSARRI
jgi:hypothetical protein